MANTKIKSKSPSTPTSLEGALRPILVVGGLLGLVSAFVILLDKIKLLQDPTFQPGCNLNPILSCGNVMQSAQSNAFGFPNPIIGLVAFGVLITIGMAMFAGARFKRWFWLGLQIGTLFGLFFVHWLFFQSTYRIGFLCPYCIVVWIVTITTFWYVLLYNLEQKHIVVKGKLLSAANFMRRHHLDILILWFAVMTALILKRFWYYYGQFLP